MVRLSREEADEALGLGETPRREAVLACILAATGLFGVEVEFDAEPFKQVGPGPARLRVKRVSL